MDRKGIILAGGTGSRLFPLTNAVSKQLLPVFDKPMIFYPLTTLMLSGIKEFLIITTEDHLPLFKSLLDDGSSLGIKISYTVQPNPDGIAHAFIIGEEFIGDSSVVLILGDNLYHGNYLIQQLNSKINSKGASIFAYSVSDPERYCVVEFDKYGKVISLEEKPIFPKSEYVVTGIYFYDNSVVKKSKTLKPSLRGELEITDLNNLYLIEGTLNLEILGRGVAWLDTGTFDSLHEASSYIRTIEKRQGLKVGSPEEAAFRKGWIDESQLKNVANKYNGSAYGEYLKRLIEK